MDTKELTLSIRQIIIKDNKIRLVYRNFVETVLISLFTRVKDKKNEPAEPNDLEKNKKCLKGGNMKRNFKK